MFQQRHQHHLLTKIARVVETFNPKRNNVNNNNKEGKIENSNASCHIHCAKNNNNANVILIIIKKLNNHDGNGITKHSYN